MAQTKAEHNAEPKPPRGRRPKVTMPDSTLVAPTLPTSGVDLMGVWELDPAAWTEGRVKLARREYASNQVALVGEFSVADYNLGNVAMTHGPGEYLLTLSPDPMKRWLHRNAKVIVTPAYAVANGFQQVMQTQAAASASMPTVRDVTSLQRTVEALRQDRAPSMAELGDLMETMVTRAVDAAVRAVHGTPTAPPPMGGMEGVMGIWNMLSTVQAQTEARMMKLMEAAQGRPVVEVEGDGTGGWGSVIKDALPAIQALFQSLIPRPADPVQPTSAGQPALSQSEAPMQVDVPLTSNEIALFAGAVAMLKPFVGSIILPLFDRVPDDLLAAQQLAEYIPGPLVDQVIHLAELTAARGEKCLAVLDPRLATPRAAAVVAKLADLLKSEES